MNDDLSNNYDSILDLDRKLSYSLPPFETLNSNDEFYMNKDILLSKLNLLYQCLDFIKYNRVGQSKKRLKKKLKKMIHLIESGNIKKCVNESE